MKKGNELKLLRREKSEEIMRIKKVVVVGVVVMSRNEKGNKWREKRRNNHIFSFN